VRVDARFAIAAAFSRVPPFLRYGVILVARKLWLPSLVAMPAPAAAPADHRIGVRLREHRACELAGAATDRAEQRPFGIGAQAGAVDITGEYSSRLW